MGGMGTDWAWGGWENARLVGRIMPEFRSLTRWRRTPRAEGVPQVSEWARAALGFEADETQRAVLD